MLTLEEARKYLPDEYKDKPDEEVRKIMDNIQGLVELAFEVLQDNLKKEKDVFEKLLVEVKPQFKLDIAGDHGLPHWKRVKRIGLYLASGTDADWRVITLFSALHDSCREDEGNDKLHGKRATVCAMELYKKGLLPVNDKQLDQLLVACTNHSDRNFKTDDITIQTCLDADRLDLYRLGDIPDDKFLYTEVAKKRETKDFVLKLLGK